MKYLPPGGESAHVVAGGLPGVHPSENGGASFVPEIHVGLSRDVHRFVIRSGWGRRDGSGVGEPEAVSVFLCQIEHPLHDIRSISFKPIFIRASGQLPHGMTRHAAVHVLPLRVMSSEPLLERRIDCIPFSGGTGGKVFSQIDIRVDDGRIHCVGEPAVDGIHVPLGDLRFFIHTEISLHVRVVIDKMSEEPPVPR